VLLSKKNIAEFNDDVRSNDGYLYTTNPPLSSIFANDRISHAVNTHIGTHKSLVDIGCGDGVYTGEIKKKFPDLEIEGFDPAEDAIALAQKKYPDITFRAMNILDKDLGQSTRRRFEVGVLRGVLHHLSDQELAIRNSFAIADRIIIVEPNGNNPILKIIEKVSPYHRLHEEQSFTYWQLKNWVEEAGGNVVFGGYVGFVPFFFPEFPSKVIRFFQPVLEKIPLVREFFSAQIVIVGTKNSAHS